MKRTSKALMEHLPHRIGRRDLCRTLARPCERPVPILRNPLKKIPCEDLLVGFD